MPSSFSKPVTSTEIPVLAVASPPGVFGASAAILPYEILILIFSPAPRETLAVAACVCQIWSNAALDILWRYPRSFVGLLRFLAPLEEYKSKEHGRPMKRFARHVTAGDWHKFQRIASPVRGLSVNSCINRIYDIPTSMIEEIARSCPFPHFLPSLRSLRIMPRQDWHSVHTKFLCPTIKILTIKRHADLFVVPSLIEIQHMLNLEKLTLTGYLDEEEHVNIVLGLLKSLTQLTQIFFNAPSSVTRAVLNTASHLPSLQTIGFTGSSASLEFVSSTLDARDSDPRAGQFATLRKFRSSDGSKFTLVQYCDVFATHTLRHLDKLQIAVPDEDGVRNEVADQYRRLFILVAGTCPTLAHLELSFGSGGGYIATDFEAVTSPLSYHTLEPLVDNLHLTTFNLAYPVPLQLSQANLNRIAEAWGPTLKYLDLNHGPDTSKLETELDLTALVPFAASCRQLEYLAMYLDLTVEVDLIESPPTFSSTLHTLQFGTSLVNNPRHVIEFLSSLFNPLGQSPQIGAINEYGVGPWETIRYTLDLLDERVRRALHCQATRRQ